ncbi:TPA: VWA domain-containing protein [Methanosarcina acetivorans]|uniref:VWFA domain-containing protein n=2 Tax=Methanosarcina acetivorans TaxID=2214 RepID=Q8TU27_METAC|nr:VWA domain-containing protein [Methanosarcina acetivorans]AAM03700.1 hypothetical protein (multi-domain) [Methanosarcina acetivorans C2A]HIH95124.1 VWA domain-containing protein [Methanosarcina acetivorans]
MEWNKKIKENLLRSIFFASVLGVVAIVLTGAVSAQAIAEPAVSKTASPALINIAGSGVNEETTVTIEVTGAGSTSTSAVPMDVVFAIDSSGSMQSNDPSGLRKTAAKSFVDKMDSSRDTAGVVSWDDSIDFSLPLTNDFPLVKTNIDSVDSSGSTNLNVGLEEAIDILDANPRTENSVEVIIFLTDGQGTYLHSTAQEAADKGYVIYSIGLGGVNPTPLQDMATTTGGAYYSSPDATSLQAIFDDIFSEVTTSTIPYYVDVVEVTQDYIVDESSFNIAPDTVIPDGSGTTTIIWNNIGLSSDGDPDLSDDETVVLSFNAKSDQSGTNLEVDVFGTAKVNYKDSEGGDGGSVNIPQAYITVNGAPVADAGEDQVVEQANWAGTSVTLDGSGSTDDGLVSPLTYTWTWDGESASGVSPTVSLPLGTTTITLEVFDGQLSDTDTVEITVQDTTLPEITASGEPIIFWAPNHKYETVSISDCVESVTDICDVDVGVDDIIITSVSSDEPEDSPDKGDGATLEDIVIVDPQTVDLRAERQGDGNGRVYTINYEVTDASGNTATGSCQVWVPHDQDEGTTAVDDGAAAGYTVNYP